MRTLHFDMQGHIYIICKLTEVNCRMELLAPAGSPESVIAAVQSGANAIYLGAGSFNARRNAANFSMDELAAAIEYCHLRDVRVYLTMNTLLYDRELEEAARLLRQVDALGIDAVLVQDLGVLRMLRSTAPSLPVHASTQMTLHNLDGIKLAADLGIERAVLSRELSRDQIAHLCAHSPIELEVFVHGALCMCYSGQCYFSSVIGGRSGNRGLCAQPCRLKYGWNGKANQELLSLKDLSLVRYLQDFKDMGVACAKIEGRMKRPEYVAVVTGIYASILRDGRMPTEEELAQLASAFSRQGFTQGYYLNRKGPAMFGVHREGATDPMPLFKAAKAEYSRGEHCRIPIQIHAALRADQPVTVTAQDSRGNRTVVTGPVPEPALKRALTGEEVARQLSKAGGTPYVPTVTCQMDPNLSLPLSALNALRREALDSLSVRRIQPPHHIQREWHLPAPVKGKATDCAYTVALSRWDQLTEGLLSLAPERVEIPLALAADTERLQTAAQRCTLALLLPRILWDNERDRAVRLLRSAREVGVRLCLCSTWGSVRLAQEEGFTALGDYGLGVTNSESLRALRELGLASATLSFEQRLARLRDLSHELPTELIVYGRLPLMITENCIISNRTGGKCRHGCQTQPNLLTDRRGAGFPVVQAWGCRNELLNSKILYLADKPDYKGLHCRSYRLLFTTEQPDECIAIFKQYLGLEPPAVGDFTRGLYYRDVE